MRMYNRWYFFAVLFLCCVCYVAIFPSSYNLFADTDHNTAVIKSAFDPMEEKQLQRYHQLLKVLRCPRCEGQNIAESNAAVAVSIKNQVYDLMLAGKNNTEIKDYLVKRYGESILFLPRFNWQNAILWLAPFLVLSIVSLWFILRYTVYKAANKAKSGFVKID